MIQRAALTVAVLVCTGHAALAVAPGDCAALRRHGHQTEAAACFRSLTVSADPYLRAEGDWGLELYDAANNEFRAAVARADSNATYRVRWGRLLHERFNNTDASGLFTEALHRDPRNANAYVGLAVVAAADFDRKAREYAEKALEIDARQEEARELLADLALEDSNPAEAVRQADLAIQLAPDALDAFAIRAAVELLADRSPDAWVKRMLEVNPAYGQGFALMARHLVLNRRYDDGVAYYRKAIDLDPRLWSARSQLGINLMRLGQEEEPHLQLELSFKNGYRDAATANSLKLLDSYKNFTITRTPQTILKLDTKEATLLKPYVDDVLKRAMATYAQKYKMTLPGPVQVEIYPNHEDFAVRTDGLPGLGALGVTFGTVVAMDSPSGRPPGSFNWAATLWHEMDHVYVLAATRHRAPRWFAEGLAVHEEGLGNPAWSDRLTPDVVVALKAKKMLPVSELDRGFVHPEYPEQILVSYYQAGRVCDYIQELWGAEALVEMVRAFGELTPTPEVIQRTLGVAPATFDEQFQTWLYQHAGPIVTQFDEWRTGLKRLVELVNSGQTEAALEQGEAVRRLYPEYVHDANAYEFLAELKSAKGDKAGAMAVLVDYQKFGGSRPATLKKLASLQEEMGRFKDAAATLDGINEIYPVNDEDLHRRLGALWLKQENFAGAVREYAAVVALHPLDKAGALYDLAQAYFSAHQLDKAETTVLGALEAAPGYRPAQQLLLKIEDAASKRRQ
ncbi:MAG TPA: tetratricopeptide repeat protein [Vicinamibacterales bacterium]|nr:tetratricopeptide repeat protein [Vicinamibacterales bacterium]